MAFISKDFEAAVKSVTESVQPGSEAEMRNKFAGLKKVSESVELESVELDEAAPFDKGTVTINKPGHRMHGKVGHVFFKHSDGAVNVQVRGAKKGDTSNFTLKHDEFKMNESVELDELEGLTEEELITMAESFEDKLEKIRAKIAKKPKDDYEFAPEKPKSAKTAVTGTYGKSWTDLDDEGKDKVTTVQATQVKRGRGRPRGSKNI